MAPRQSQTVQLLAASAGNALEFYDFTVFAYFAPQIANAFFPSSTPAGSMLSTWGTFAVAFVARPLGAIWLGSYADRLGRKAAMTTCIVLMTLGTLLLTIMPSYARIGVLAPLGVLLARLTQGFAAGGEFGGATAFMMEHAERRRGFIASFQFTSQSVATIAGSAVAFAVHQLMAPAAVQDWGFRVPFAAGLLIAPVGLYLRRHAEETPVFLRTGPAAAPALAALRTYPGRIVLGACTVAGGTALSYLVLYLPTYAQHELHAAATSSYVIPAAAGVLGLVATPLAAHWSDSAGRLLPAFVGIILLGALAYPGFLLVNAAPHVTTLTAVILALAFVRSAYTGPMPALLGEMFPPDMRGVGMSVSYALGVMVFGGTAPVAVTWLISSTGNRTMPGVYLAACSLITLVTLIIIARRVSLVQDETPGRPALQTFGQPSTSGGRDP